MEAYEVIRNHMRSNGITQAHVAKAAGMKAALLSRSLTGGRTLTADELVSICNVLHMDIADFTQARS